nr:hypothetical protein [uncultured Hyphomonas sp.]
MNFVLETWITMHEDLCGNCRTGLVFGHLAAGTTAYAKESLGLY